MTSHEPLTIRKTSELYLSKIRFSNERSTNKQRLTVTTTWLANFNIIIRFVPCLENVCIHEKPHLPALGLASVLVVAPRAWKFQKTASRDTESYVPMKTNKHNTLH